MESEWIWSNIMDIYLDVGSNYFAVFGDLTIYSNDNYFECSISGMDNHFRVYMSRGLGSCSYEVFYNAGVSNVWHTRGSYIDRLKVIFRDYKLSKLV
jgi:hypothetical protein